MLILPLHRKPTLANFPWITLLLILVNVFVFFGLQGPDQRAHMKALDYYTEHGLAEREWPLYLEWLRSQPETRRRVLIERLNDEVSPHTIGAIIQSDSDFLKELHTGRWFSADEEGRAWRTSREEFERLWTATFTDRWALRYSELDPWRMFGSMFLHGGVGHLVGNMLFLALLGLLVEGALRHGLFLVVYFLGGLGAALASLAWRWGDSGMLVGASGAIAGLMGAYCVLWGLRKVRFFWWFFVVFDYVKAPALILLPLWLGWELAQMLLVRGSNVAFDAHAGGIVTGALLAFAIVRLGWEDRDFLDEDVRADLAESDRKTLAQAREHLGRLQVAEARALLQPIAERQPDDFELHVLLYRCARCEPGTPRLHEAVRPVLTRGVRSAVETRLQKEIFDDYRTASKGQLRLPADALIALARRWPTIGEGRDATKLLSAMAERAPATPGLDDACVAVARELGERREHALAQAMLRAIVAAWPGSVHAGKAEVLLSEVG